MRDFTLEEYPIIDGRVVHRALVFKQGTLKEYLDGVLTYTMYKQNNLEGD